MNLVRAELEGESIHFAGHRVPLDESAGRPREAPGQVILGIRPEDFEDVRFSPPGLPTIDVQITLVEDLGPEALAFFALDTERVEPETLGVPSDRDRSGGDDRRRPAGALLGDPRSVPRRPARATTADSPSTRRASTSSAHTTARACSAGVDRRGGR